MAKSPEYIDGMKRVMNLIDEAVHLCEGPHVAQTQKAKGAIDGWKHVQKSLAAKLAREMNALLADDTTLTTTPPS